MEGMSAISHLRVLPCRTVPTGIPVEMACLGIVDMRIGYHGVVFVVNGNLPNPVAYAGTIVYYGIWIIVFI